ncbi:hypothetical protein ACFU8Q_23885 [Streptomyces sp. NPDC057543]|uniref:hypothetical protein n=1 Tax=Streptomyces sp. NPDC057543 TaxID=3346163 RepID=UPI003673BC3A
MTSVPPASTPPRSAPAQPWRQFLTAQAVPADVLSQPPVVPDLATAHVQRAVDLLEVYARRRNLTGCAHV